MKRALLLPLLVFPLIAYSQQRNTHNLFWGRLAFTDRINKRLDWEFALQARTQNNYSNDPNIFHSFQFKSYAFSLQYSLRKNLDISISPLGFYKSHILNNKESDVSWPITKEFRWSIRLDHETKGRYFLFTNRFAVEYRWRDFQSRGEYNGNWRIRYMIRFEKSVMGILSSTKPVTFTLYNDIFFQVGHAVKNNHTVFDQNRLYLGASYEIIQNTEFNLGYAYGFQIRPSGEEYDNINSLYVGLTFNNLFSQFSKPKSNSNATPD